MCTYLSIDLESISEWIEALVHFTTSKTKSCPMSNKTSLNAFLVMNRHVLDNLQPGRSYFVHNFDRHKHILAIFANQTIAFVGTTSLPLICTTLVVGIRLS